MLSRDVGEVGERMFCPKHIVCCIAKQILLCDPLLHFCKRIDKEEEDEFHIVIFVRLLHRYRLAVLLLMLCFIEFACKVSLVFV